MILFLSRNDEKWPHTRQIKIAGRNHILPPLGIASKTNINNSQEGIKIDVKLSKISSTRQSLVRNMIQSTPEQRTFVIKTFYETNSLQQARVAFGLTNFA